MENINWKQYREIFPERYTKHGVFDDRLLEFIESFGGNLKVLDIGGGLGTKVLNRSGVKTWLLDPNVLPSKWMEGSINWSKFYNLPPNSFDLAVLRGSLNYLEKSQISKIPEVCRMVMANSFDRPKPGYKARRYKSLSSGKCGVEISDTTGVLNKKCKLNVKTLDDKIKHILVDSEMNVIVHNFYAYGYEYFNQVWPNAKIERYRNNSLLITIGI